MKSDTGSLVSISEDIGVGHAERIGPAFARLLSQAELEPGVIKRIGVTVGPGSFMGQRIGIAFAKGLVLGSGAATVPLTTLEALAVGQGPVSVAIDARRGQVYFQTFAAGGQPTGEAELIDYDDAASRLQSAKGIGSGVAAATDAAPEGPLLPSAEALLELTLQKDPAPLRTLYLRGPDAKPPTKKPL